MKKIVSVIILLAIVGTNAAAETPLKFALLPDIGIPQDNNLVGLELGFADTMNDVTGLQLCWIYNGSRGKVTGAQIGLVNTCDSLTGIQWGFYNKAQSVTGFQIGVINQTSRMNGIQIGLLNFISTGSPLPFMVFINGNF